MSSALFPCYARSPLAFSHGKGARLFGTDGKVYLDFYAGIAVNSLGHGDSGLVAALKAQGEKVWHLSNLYTIPQQEALAERICADTFADRVFFGNSGAEAIECAIKTARRYHYARGAPHRQKIIALDGAFHGRTFGGIAASGQAGMLEGFGDPLPGFVHIPPDDLDALRAAFDEDTAAFLVEPIQGEGGIRAISPDHLRAARDLCEASGALLIFDEIQCGLARTGTLFAYEGMDVEPDIMAIAKGLGGGFPIGACLAREAVAQVMVPGTHGSTFGGGPLACAVALYVWERLAQPDFLRRVQEKGARLREGLIDLIARHGETYAQVRGRGLMQGLVVRAPSREAVAALRELRLLSAPSGADVIRLLPPLIVSDGEIDEALTLLQTYATERKS